jgi:hypothetical protein
MLDKKTDHLVNPIKFQMMDINGENRISEVKA